MDKLIKKVAVDIKHGEKKKAEKDVSHLLKVDKKQDRKMMHLEKKEHKKR